MLNQITDEYGVLYAKYCYPKEHKFHWLGHCNIFNIAPVCIQNEIRLLSKEINLKYQSDIIVNMDISVMPGCVSDKNIIHNIASDIYERMSNIIENNFNEIGRVRIVYGIGTLPKYWIENNVKSAHQIGSFPFMVKLGRTFDKNWESGIFQI